MIFHVVLFEPRANLSIDDRSRFAAALAKAAREIPSIRRVQVGKRVAHGAVYESFMKQPFGFAAVIEFDDLAALQAYLQHPAHEAVGAGFYAYAERMLAFDYEMRDGQDASALVQ